jgi:glycosyltransferase involved in cell wall biosynthesis
LGLQNIHFHDSVPKTEGRGLIAACDIAVMTLFRSPLIDIYFQNKFIDYLGSGRAIVAAMEGQQADILKRCNAGKVVSTYDYQGLSQLIEEAADNPQMYQQMGENGKSTVHRSLLLSDILERYCKVIESVAAGKAREIPAWEPELDT